jgi:TIR domain
MAINYLTEAQLKTASADIAVQLRKRMVEAAEGRKPVNATFLSHSSKDAEMLPALIQLLEQHGASVYVDKKDSLLPPYTNRETAEILRDRIKQCRKFLLFATENSKNSRWVPWELGLADGFKSQRNVAIIPALGPSADKAWTEQEYLGIYDRVVRGDMVGESEKVWMVLNQEKNTACTLNKWLSR